MAVQRGDSPFRAVVVCAKLDGITSSSRMKTPMELKASGSTGSRVRVASEYGSIRAVNARFRIDQALFARIRVGKIEALREFVGTDTLLLQLIANRFDTRY